MNDKKITGSPIKQSSALQSNEDAKEKTILPVHDNRHSVAVLREPVRCAIEYCSMPGICSLELRRLCVDHFISRCFDRLRRCIAFPSLDRADTAFEWDNRFLRECVLEASMLVQPGAGIDNARRAKLFEIFLWTSELAFKRSGPIAGETPESDQNLVA